ncbi:triacylglycerol lipase [Natrinema pallidum]|uniref:Alpha/beta fold hydrolase n=1 Tax=Natrinema pallidum TaxID=69527 RepID=A0A4P9TF98_9EURY|nr:alpha/beta fold hydrolase [Natrinema pallidum]QCW02805.1 alpha/beta fold hydrolase [Natrinema pallidum]
MGRIMAANDNTGERSGRDARTARRPLLRAAGTTLIGGGGLAATTGAASAQVDTPDVIEVNDGFFGWSADGSLPVTDELFVFIHGWFGDTTVSSQASTVQNALESGGYTPTESVAIEWPATNVNYLGAESDTEDVGAVVADLVEDFDDAGGGNVRLVGHSLGGRCVYWTATKLGSDSGIETVAGLGTAAHGSEICGEPWNAGLGTACEVRNYHSQNDSMVGSAYGGIGDTALGTDGAGCSPASNYSDVDVTGSVGSHLEYLGDDAVGSDLADAITTGGCE